MTNRKKRLTRQTGRRGDVTNRTETDVTNRTEADVTSRTERMRSRSRKEKRTGTVCKMEDLTRGCKVIVSLLTYLPL